MLIFLLFLHLQVKFIAWTGHVTNRLLTEHIIQHNIYLITANAPLTYNIKLHYLKFDFGYSYSKKISC